MRFRLEILLLFVSFSLFAQEETNYSAVFLTKNSSNTITGDELQKLENEHLRSIGRLSDSGILLNGGPLEGAGEFLILAVSGRDEAVIWLEKDPANFLYDAEILSFELRYGQICDPDLPYEMKTYSLVRYYPTNQIASYKSNADFQMQTGHDAHIKMMISSGQVVAEGTFGGNDGGLIIYEKDALNKTVQKDPAIADGYLKTNSFTIWLNKGSFCTL
jgi:hypothetical protein